MEKITWKFVTAPFLNNILILFMQLYLHSQRRILIRGENFPDPQLCSCWYSFFVSSHSPWCPEQRVGVSSRVGTPPLPPRRRLNPFARSVHLGREDPRGCPASSGAPPRRGRRQTCPPTPRTGRWCSGCPPVGSPPPSCWRRSCPAVGGFGWCWDSGWARWGRAGDGAAAASWNRWASWTFPRRRWIETHLVSIIQKVQKNSAFWGQKS